jgi:hypothetical protein
MQTVLQIPSFAEHDEPAVVVVLEIVDWIVVVVVEVVVVVPEHVPKQHFISLSLQV